MWTSYVPQSQSDGEIYRKQKRPGTISQALQVTKQVQKNSFISYLLSGHI